MSWSPKAKAHLGLAPSAATPADAGPVLDAIRSTLDRWLGRPRWKQTEGRVTLTYRFVSDEQVPLKLKVEINTREHFTVFGLRHHRFELDSSWFSGTADIPTYELEELLGTKLRALYQRKKGRDLYDLALALQIDQVSVERVIEAFVQYLAATDTRITREMFERNLKDKRTDSAFVADMATLLASGRAWSFDDAFEVVWRDIVSRVPGESTPSS